MWSALGNAAGQRVLFRSGEALERLAEIAAVRFDKTGTLTTGSATVSDCVVEPSLICQTLTLATAATPGGGLVSCDVPRHRRVRQARQIDASDDVSEIRVVPGLGVIGMLSPPRVHRSCWGAPVLDGARISFGAGPGYRRSSRRRIAGTAGHPGRLGRPGRGPVRF